MIQFSFSRNQSIQPDQSAWILGSELGIEYEDLGTYEKSWNLFATRIIDVLTDWCKTSGIKYFGVGHTQIAIQITFVDKSDAMLFKLRWHDAQTA